VLLAVRANDTEVMSDKLYTYKMEKSATQPGVLYDTRDNGILD